MYLNNYTQILYLDLKLTSGYAQFHFRKWFSFRLKLTVPIKLNNINVVIEKILNYRFITPSITYKKESGCLILLLLFAILIQKFTSI